MLLSQPDILKKMDELKKNKQPMQTNRRKSEYEKNQLKMQVNYKIQLSNMQNSKNVVDSLLKTTETAEKKEKVVVDLENQESSFKKKLEAKRNKMNLNKSDVVKENKVLDDLKFDVGQNIDADENSDQSAYDEENDMVNELIMKIDPDVKSQFTAEDEELQENKKTSILSIDETFNVSVDK